jgi:hypothetical protein
MYRTRCLYGAGRNDFDAGTIHYEGSLEGVGPEIETFLGPKIATSEASAIWGPQKSRFHEFHEFQGPPLFLFNGPRNG